MTAKVTDESARSSNGTNASQSSHTRFIQDETMTSHHNGLLNQHRSNLSSLMGNSTDEIHGGSRPHPASDALVLIIGGGPIGLLAGILLAKRGMPSVILERHASRLGQPKAHAINPRSLEILRQAGLDTVHLRKLGASAEDADAVRFVLSMKGLEVGNLPYERQDEAVKNVTPEPLFNIAQSTLENYLWQTALETGLITIWREFQWQSCVELGNKMISSIVLDRQNGREFTITSRYLLGCDGAHARSRAHFQIPFDTLDGRPSNPIHYVSVNIDADMSKEKTGTLWFIMTKDAGKRNFIAYDRSCNWVFVTTYDPRVTPREIFTEKYCRSLIDKSIGGQLDYNVIGVTLWNTTPRVAKYYRSRAIRNGFLAGDAAHCFPSTGGLGINTGFGDVHNLVWKMHAVTRGLAKDSLLDTYEVERIPIAIANSSQSHLNEARIHRLGQAVFGSSDTPVEERLKCVVAQQEINQAISNNSDHFDSLDLQIGFVYGQLRPANKSVSNFTPQCIPGARLPHAWIKSGDRSMSTLDLVDGFNFVLFASPGLANAKVIQFGGVNIDVIQTTKDFIDVAGEWTRLMGLDRNCTGVLVRPDQHIVSKVGSLEDVTRAVSAALNF